MIYFETYRNNIKKLDVDENFFIKNSKIEKIFENADLFFFSLTNFKKGKFLKEEIKSNKISICKYENMFVISSFKITNKILTLTHKLFAEKRIIKNDSKLISIRKKKYKINQRKNCIEVKPRAEEKLNYYSAYKGIVDVEECDQMAHMNVQFYFKKHSEAIALFAGEVFDNKSSFAIESERCIFHKEVHEANSLEIGISVKQIKKNSITILSNLYCVSGKYVSAYFETMIKFGKDQKEVKDKISKLTDKTQSTFFNNNNFEDIRKLDNVNIGKKPAKNSFITCRKAVNSWDLDENGNATSKFKISCVSDAATQFFTRCGADYNWRNNYQIGSAALDYFVRYYKSPSLGMALSLKSNFLEVGKKSFKFCHHLIDDSSNKVLMDIQIVAVLFDIKKRKAIEIPKSFKKLALDLIAKR